MREWSRALYEAGYVGLTWPEEYGGGGAPYTHQAIFLEEMARAEDSRAGPQTRRTPLGP
jgi:alkylation response protein AidB-like acyl-CoA dehydrogenase